MLAYNKGKLVKWHDDRGYGFVEPENNAKQVFLHISVLRRRAERRPQEGDVIWYQLDMDSQDRIQASNAYIEGISYGSMTVRPVPKDRGKNSRSAAIRMTQRQESRDDMQHISPKRDKRGPRFQKQTEVPAMDRFQKHREQQKILFYIAIVIVGIVGFFILKGILSITQYESSIEIPQNQTSSFSSTSSSQNFQCAGKKRCGEMASCEEAIFYQNNCPGTEMDGDGDGKPCEDWCGH